MRKTVSLVLSSGGARGVAHIGVIDELERQGLEITSIAGSSMGALVGGIYASGHLKDYKDWMCLLDKKEVLSLIDFTLSPNGLVKGNRLINELKKIVPDVNIEDLPIPYSAVAVDIKNKKEVVFNNGSLFDAIRASISIPTVFTPLKLDGMILIDGGVMNPIPINRVKRSNNDILVVVDVSHPTSLNKQTSKIISSKDVSTDLICSSLLKDKGFNFHSNISKEHWNYYTLLTESSSMMIQKISELTIEQYQPDILIQVPLSECGTFQFFKSREIIEAGELAAETALIEYQTKKQEYERDCINNFCLQRG